MFIGVFTIGSSMTDFLPVSICSVLLDVASGKNRPSTYSLQSVVLRHITSFLGRAAAASGGLTSIDYNGRE